MCWWKHSFCRVAHISSSRALCGDVESMRSQDWGVREALMVPETWESSVKLSHDVTVTMEQVSSELCVGGSTPSVGWHILVVR